MSDWGFTSFSSGSAISGRSSYIERGRKEKEDRIDKQNIPHIDFVPREKVSNPATSQSWQGPTVRYLLILTTKSVVVVMQ